MKPSPAASRSANHRHICLCAATLPPGMTSSAVSVSASAFSNVGGPVPSSARQGRHRQRYGDSGERLVAGCIPVRFLNRPESANDVEVCMITTTNGKGLVFPKGGWEDDESVESAAQRETVEEAGVRGVLEEPLLGVFSFASGKQLSACLSGGGASGDYTAGGAGSSGNGSGTCASAGGALRGSGRCKAYIFVMHVAEELPAWPESKDRQRVWCSLPEASRQCKHEWMREALRAWVRRRGWADAVQLDGGAQPQCAGASPTAAQQQQHHEEQRQQQHFAQAALTPQQVQQDLVHCSSFNGGPPAPAVYSYSGVCNSS